jgi:hypothetical protein
VAWLALLAAVKTARLSSFKKNDPRPDVVGMPELALDAEVRAGERGSEFGDQFLGRVGFRAEAVAEFAFEVLVVAAPMAFIPILA